MSRVQAKNLTKFWKIEAPSGTINGSNKVFTLSQKPLENDATLVFLDGLLQTETTDYTLSNSTLTFVTAPALGQSVRVQYVQYSGGE
jgi:hypothetical protein